MAEEEPPQIPALPPRNDQLRQHGLQFIRQPPLFKSEMDLGLYLRRFQAYINGINAMPDEIPHILINCLDDESLRSIERHIRDDITYDQLVVILCRELGTDRNSREDFKAKLHKTLRGRNEKVRAFYIKLWSFAKKAYPDNPEVRSANLRDAFIMNLQDSGISARLRERPDDNNEAILELAVTLMNCKNASVGRQIDTAAVEVEDSDSIKSLSAKFDDLLDFISPSQSSNVQIPTATASSSLATGTDSQYQYQGPKQSSGLNNNQQTFNYQQPYNTNHQLNSRQFQPRYSDRNSNEQYSSDPNSNFGSDRQNDQIPIFDGNNGYRPRNFGNNSYSWRTPSNYKYRQDSGYQDQYRPRRANYHYYPRTHFQ